MRQVLLSDAHAVSDVILGVLQEDVVPNLIGAVVDVLSVGRALRATLRAAAASEEALRCFGRRQAPAR